MIFTKKDIKTPELEIPNIVLSDAMLKRDNFFHSCWMLLKFRNQHLATELQEVELIISGYDLSKPDEQLKQLEKEGIIL